MLNDVWTQVKAHDDSNRSNRMAFRLYLTSNIDAAAAPGWISNRIKRQTSKAPEPEHSMSDAAGLYAPPPPYSRLNYANR